MAEIFGTSYEILKGRDYGLEDIVNLLREYELTEEEKKEIIMGTIYQFTPTTRYSIFENTKKGDCPSGNRLFYWVS